MASTAGPAEGNSPVTSKSYGWTCTPAPATARRAAARSSKPSRLTSSSFTSALHDSGETLTRPTDRTDGTKGETQMKKTVAILTLALALPSVALAAKPGQSATKGHKGTPTATVRYVLHGTLWSYTPASSTANGSITIHVTRSNHHGALLKGTDL